MSPPDKAPKADKQFDDVLKRMLNTPPDHKPRTKTGVPKKGGRTKDG